MGSPNAFEGYARPRPPRWFVPAVVTGTSLCSIGLFGLYAGIAGEPCRPEDADICLEPSSGYIGICVALLAIGGVALMGGVLADRATNRLRFNPPPNWPPAPPGWTPPYPFWAPPPDWPPPPAGWTLWVRPQRHR